MRRLSKIRLAALDLETIEKYYRSPIGNGTVHRDLHLQVPLRRWEQLDDIVNEFHTDTRNVMFDC